MHDKFDVFSTGVLTREPQTITAVVNIANLDKHKTRKIVVEVLDWSTYSNPIKVPVLIGENEPVVFPYELQPKNLAVMYADLDETVSLYEIRIQYLHNANIIANCFGRSRPPYTSQVGNTVLQSSLIDIGKS